MTEKKVESRKSKSKQGSVDRMPKSETPTGKRGRPANPNARSEILKAAAAAFMERGFSGTSIDDIARDIGVTKGFIYHQFTNKSDLYFSVQEIATQNFHDAVLLEYQTEAAPDEKLKRMAHAHVVAMLTNFPPAKVGVQGLERSLMGAAGDAERLRLQHYIHQRDEYEAMFITVIRDGIAAGQFSDGNVGVLAKGLMGALNWATIWFNPNRPTSQQEIEDIAQTLATFVVRGLSK